MNTNEGSFLTASFLQVLFEVFDSQCLSFLAEVKPVKFSSNSFLVLQFKESYRREQQREERESNSARKRRAVSPSSERFSIRFRTRGANGLLLLASDSATTIVSGYTVLEVGWIVILSNNISSQNRSQFLSVVIMFTLSLLYCAPQSERYICAKPPKLI